MESLPSYTIADDAPVVKPEMMIDNWDGEQDFKICIQNIC